MKKLYFVIITLLCFFIFAGCAKEKDVSTFRFEARNIKMVEGDTRSLNLVFGDEKEKSLISYQIFEYDNEKEDFVKDVKTSEFISLEGSGEKDGLVTTLSNKENVQVTALKEGKVKVRAFITTNKNISDVIYITVSKKSLNGMTLKSSSDVCWVGDTIQMSIINNPSTIKDTTASYKSSNTNIATVDENGVVTGVSVGVCTITATSTYDNIYAKKQISVEYQESSKIIPNQLNVELTKGETFQITYTQEPKYTNPECTFISSNPNVCKVDLKTGLVTSVEGGECYITIKNKDNKASQNVNFKINYTESTGINVEENQSIDLNSTLTLTGSVTPLETANQNINYTILTGDDVVKFDENTPNIIKSLKIGTATIKAETADGKFNKVITITSKYADPTSITFDSKNLIVGGEFELNAKVLPNNASNEVIITISDPTVLSETEGVIKALKKGTCKIIVCAKANSDVLLEKEVIVIDDITNINVLSNTEGLTISKTDVNNVNFINKASFSLKLEFTPETEILDLYEVTASTDKVKFVRDNNIINVESSTYEDFTITISCGSYSCTIKFKCTIILQKDDMYWLDECKDCEVINTQVVTYDFDENAITAVNSGETTIKITKNNDEIIEINVKVIE